jgi:putative nucleotidyltransferase with HDIG domain
MASTTGFARLLPALDNAMVVYHHRTAEHSARVGALAREIGGEVGLDGADLEVLHWAGLLHDIGKLAVPEEVLTKPGPLTAEEWATVRRHCAVGSDLLRAITPELGPLADAVRAHHERWDGSGYPDGLVGEEIPVAGRIVAVADVYDALTHPRAYRREPFSSDAATEYLVARAGSLFDRQAIDAFLRVPAGLGRG